MVTKKRTDTLLIGPGKNNTLGLRPGAVEVGNKFGNRANLEINLEINFENPTLTRQSLDIF